MDILTFEGFRATKNMVLHETFTKRFMTNCRKFDSLSKQNPYRKIQRKNFIEKSGDDDNITNILNKISEPNFDRLQTKILMKLNVHNALSFCQQIFDYSHKSSVNSTFLAKLLFEIGKGLDNVSIHNMIESVFNVYVDDFLSIFEGDQPVTDLHEDYHGFLERNLNTIKTKNTSMFMLAVFKCTHKERFLTFKHDTNSVFSILCDKIHRLTSNTTTNINDEFVFKILECMLLFLSMRALGHDSEEMRQFKSKIILSEVGKKLKNKTRFKLMDILDYK